ncbi:2-phospho-L-lactate transferase [Halobacteriales archaeon QS_1_68_20]|nr:MAG: 2-phospho-L-lactate transferase [Halobacteriales archaeon QS_1_68_20]
MVTFLSGGTGTPKLLWGADAVFPREETTVVANTGDDVEIGGLLVCPDVDTVLFERADLIDRDRWWGIAGDTERTHEAMADLAERLGTSDGPHYLPDGRQTDGRRIARWRRFAAVPPFMTLGDRDRAIHGVRTSLLDQGYSLTEVTRRLADAFDLRVDLLPMSDDPVASIVHTPDGGMHFQEYWVAERGAPAVESVEFRGGEDAAPTDAVLTALDDPVVVGPSNPITSVGPILALDGVRDALEETPVVAVSPFVGDQVFSGPADDLMRAEGYDPSTAGLAEAYPFADAFVLDSADDTELDRPVVRTDTEMNDRADASRVARAVHEALEAVR